MKQCPYCRSYNVIALLLCYKCLDCEETFVDGEQAARSIQSLAKCFSFLKPKK